MIADPSLLPEILRKARAPLLEQRHRRRTDVYENLTVPAGQAIATLLETDEAAVVDEMGAGAIRALTEELSAYESPLPGRDIGTAGFLEVCYCITRIARPRVVLETGVGLGYSSAAILQALTENDYGSLTSVDLPVFRPGAPSTTGEAVPMRLRSPRWEVILGPDRRVLPRLLDRLGGIDLFVYDSDKSYGGMIHTWNLVWPHINPGGLLLIDDVDPNDALLDFADARDLNVQVITKPPRKPGTESRPVMNVGLLRKAWEHA